MRWIPEGIWKKCERDMDVVVVGGGPAGMMAAYHAAGCGDTVTLMEKNEKLGKKLFITGKGRCNLTNACDVTEFFDNVMRNPKFLYSAVYGFDNLQVMSFFEQKGVKLKTERGDRVFPVSDHSSDIIRAMDRALSDAGVLVKLNCRVDELICDKGEDDPACAVISGVRLETGQVVRADKVILATGGLSYRSTGSTGDGISWAEDLGHRITHCRPSLVPFICGESYIRDLQGLSLRNVSLSLFEGEKKIFEEQGELLFTHFGISGPLVLSASAMIKDPEGGEKEGPQAGWQQGKTLKGSIDLKPALSPQQLDARLLRDFEKNSNKDFGNGLDELLPKKIIPVVTQLSGIPAHKKVNKVSRQERQKLLEVLKGFPLTVTGTRGFDEAIITRGGVSVKDIDPSTMESKKVKGLFFAGEMMDVDALTGGFNLQIAWSTGYLAGERQENR